MKQLVLNLVIGSAFASLVYGDLNRGIQLYNEGKFSEAVAELKQVASEQPKNGRALTYHGLALVELGKSREALESLQRAVALNEKNVDAHYGLGLAYGYLETCKL